jgi:hypothetical protein
MSSLRSGVHRIDRSDAVDGELPDVVGPVVAGAWPWM